MAQRTLSIEIGSLAVRLATAICWMAEMLFIGDVSDRDHVDYSADNNANSKEIVSCVTGQLGRGWLAG